MQYYAPTESMAMKNKDFIRDVPAETRKKWWSFQQSRVNVTHFDEISVKSVFAIFKEDSEFITYIPELWQMESCRIKFFLKHLEYCPTWVYLKCYKACNEQRYGSDQINNQMDKIKVSDSWWAEWNSIGITVYFPLNFILESIEVGNQLLGQLWILLI